MACLHLQASLTSSLQPKDNLKYKMNKAGDAAKEVKYLS